MPETNQQPNHQRIRRFLVIIHAIIGVWIGIFVFLARFVWAGLRSEYGERGPGGEYLYDLSDPMTKLVIVVTGIAIAGVAGLMYFYVALRVSQAIVNALDLKG
jgi:heme/copper-type cytochrome/quinol oxidase subunit 2